MWPIYDSLSQNQCWGLVLIDYSIRPYTLFFEEDSIVFNDVFDDFFQFEFECYYITSKKYFLYKYGSDFLSRIKKENDSLNAIDQGYRPAYFVKHKHIYSKIQRISKYRIDNRSCFGYPNSVRAILTISSDSSIKSILIYRPIAYYSPINHKLEDEDKFAIETKRIISKLGKINPAYLRGVPVEGGEIELFFPYK